ncbi:MAG: hypothetical protein ABGY11_03940, partial [Candidatus Thioglobus sp.]
GPAYNASTGVVTNTKETVTIKVLVDTYMVNQRESNAVEKADLKVLIIQSELKTLANALITPDTNDIVNFLGKDWNILDIQQDPANSLWELQIRVSN